MDFLREEVENLKKLGRDWEMEKYQIEEAIMKAIAGIYYVEIFSKTTVPTVINTQCVAINLKSEILRSKFS